GDETVTAQTDTQKPQIDTPTSVALSSEAAAKVRMLLDQEGRDDLRLRVAVQPGGCSGLRYQLFFDERSLDGDVVTAFPTGVRAVADADPDEGYASADDAPGTQTRAGVRAVADSDRARADDAPGTATRAVEVVVDRMSA